MSSGRILLGLALITALVATLALVVRNDESGETQPTTTLQVATTALQVPTTSGPTASTAPPTTTLEAREAEVAEILQGLWFGWFDAIYRKDPDALWEVVATQEFYEAGVRAMDEMRFEASPAKELIEITTEEILLDRADCLVVYYVSEATGILGPGGALSGVQILWPIDAHGWRLATSWSSPSDLWLADCDVRLREQTP